MMVKPALLARLSSGSLATATTVLLALLAGCATPDTPETRIQQNFGVFAGLQFPVQEKIRQGQIDVGFTPDMVRMALGRPARVVTKQTAAGTTEVWSYATVVYQREMAHGSGVMMVPSRGGLRPYYRDPVWVDRPTRVETMRVEFSGGKVASIETLTPPQ